MFKCFTILIFSVLGITLGLVSAEAETDDKARWNAKYADKPYQYGEEPIEFIKDTLSLLPRGKVLDIAMGEGRNGVYLAVQGFEVKGVDISDVGLRKAEALAKKNNVTIKTEAVDLTKNFSLPDNSYDVIILSYYLQRDLYGKIKKALKPGGMAIIESYNTDYSKYNSKFNKEWLLTKNELYEEFKDLKILKYQNVDDGKVAYSSLLVKKE